MLCCCMAGLGDRDDARLLSSAAALVWFAVVVVECGPLPCISEMVVDRVFRFVVSDDGGGGRRGAWTLARQRKHSPVPKYEGAGCGASVRYAPKVCFKKNVNRVS